MTDLLLKSLLLVIGLTFCLLCSAGDWLWPAGWGVAGSYALFVVIALVLVDTELLRERARPKQGFDKVDALLASTGFLLLYPCLVVVAGLDSVRMGWSPELPVMLRVLGFAMFAMGYVVALGAMLNNPFFTTFVRVQHERGHQLVTGGPYRLVRHPGYAGMLLAHFGMPLALGSLWAYAPALLGAAVFVVRTLREERTLAAALPGYAEYLQRVRWRLWPGVW